VFVGTAGLRDCAKTGAASPGAASAGIPVVKYTASYLSQERGFFQFLDPSGDVERLRAALVAVEDRMASPQPVLVVDKVEPAGESIVARVEGEPERLEERSGPK